MTKINQEQIKALRELQYWQKEEELALRKLEQSKREYGKALIECANMNIPAGTTQLVMFDKNGSGVLEILKENGIEITE